MMSVMSSTNSSSSPSLSATASSNASRIMATATNSSPTAVAATTTLLPKFETLSGENDDGKLDKLIFELKEEIRQTSTRPGYYRYKSFLFNWNKDAKVPEDDGSISLQDPSTREEVEKLKKAIYSIRSKILNISRVYNLPVKEVLTKAVEKHKEEQKQLQQRQLQKQQQHSPGNLLSPIQDRSSMSPSVDQDSLSSTCSTPLPSMPSNFDSGNNGGFQIVENPMSDPSILNQVSITSIVVPESTTTNSVTGNPQSLPPPPPSLPPMLAPPQQQKRNSRSSSASEPGSASPAKRSRTTQKRKTKQAEVSGSLPNGGNKINSGQPVILQQHNPTSNPNLASSSIESLPQLQQVLIQGKTIRAGSSSGTSSVIVPAPQQPQSQPNPTPLCGHTREEERMLRYGKAILKLKQYRRNLKYAIWDFQDGKSISETCALHKIPEDGLRYTIDMIIKKTGETIEAFRENKSLICDEHFGPKSPEYISSLREAVVAFKQKKCGSLFVYASMNKVSLFDLIDELTKELEIESKLYRLTPVEPSKLPQLNRSHSMPPLQTSVASASTLPMRSTFSPLSASASPSQGFQLSQAVTVQSSSNSNQVIITQSVNSQQPQLEMNGNPVLSVTPSAGQNINGHHQELTLSHQEESLNLLTTSPGNHVNLVDPNQLSLHPNDGQILQVSNHLDHSQAEDSEEASILSDIDEVIRDDTGLQLTSDHLAPIITTTAATASGLNGNSNIDGFFDTSSSQVFAQSGFGDDIGNVITLNICGVCHRIFTDETLFKEHEAAGCLDFEVT